MRTLPQQQWLVLCAATKLLGAADEAPTPARQPPATPATASKARHSNAAVPDARMPFDSTMSQSLAPGIMV